MIPRRAARHGLILMLCGGWQSALAADTYRWVDDQGGTHYSDRVPPEQAKNRRARLNAQGFEVEVVETPKTREQIDREQWLKQLRAQQEKVLDERRDQDQALMRTYRNADEILAALKVKLDSLDGIVKLTETSIDRDRQGLSTLQRRAREFESRGQPIPQATRDSIAAVNRRMANYAHQIQRTENEKLVTADRFQQDLKRFQAIKAMQERHEGLDADWSRSVAKTSGNGDSDPIISAVECAGQDQCDRLWVLARDYLTRETGYPLSVETEKILQTPYHRNDTDFGITITLLPGKSSPLIFMDVICRPTHIGERLCKSARVRDMQARFQTALLEAASKITASPHGRELPPPPASGPR